MKTKKSLWWSLIWFLGPKDSSRFDRLGIGNILTGCSVKIIRNQASIGYSWALHWVYFSGDQVIFGVFIFFSGFRFFYFLVFRKKIFKSKKIIREIHIKLFFNSESRFFWNQKLFSKIYHQAKPKIISTKILKEKNTKK